MMERPGIKVLMMSGAHGDQSHRFGVARSVLARPFDGEVLKTEMQALLAGREAP